MKAARVVQFVLLFIVVAYLWWVYSVNQAYIDLPGFVALPAGVVVALVLLLGWLLGWLPSRFALWRARRANAKLRARLAEFEPSGGPEPVRTLRDPAIPDRNEPYPVAPGPDYENL